MKNGSFKRLLSGVLTSALLITCVPAVFAREYQDVTESNPAKDEIDILSDIGVIVGTSENEFSPEANVTREQMALLLFRLMLNLQIQPILVLMVLRLLVQTSPTLV
mgnify:CR=1 FL=1